MRATHAFMLYIHITSRLSQIPDYWAFSFHALARFIKFPWQGFFDKSFNKRNCKCAKITEPREANFHPSLGLYRPAAAGFLEGAFKAAEGINRCLSVSLPLFVAACRSYDISTPNSADWYGIEREAASAKKSQSYELYILLVLTREFTYHNFSFLISWLLFMAKIVVLFDLSGPGLFKSILELRGIFNFLGPIRSKSIKIV